MAHNRSTTRLSLAGLGALALLAAGNDVAGSAPALAATATSAPASTPWRAIKEIALRNADVSTVSVDALSPDNAWALTEVDYANGNVKPLLQHWNGLRWRQFTIPARIVKSFNDTTLWDSFGVSPDGTLWAFALNGTYLNRSSGRWRSGVLPHGGTVEAIAVFSRTDVWALGGKGSGSDLNLTFQPYAAHFNGTTWKTVKVPGTSDISLVSAVSPSDMYAVTGTLSSIAKPTTPRVLHWNGSTWKFLPVQPSFTGQTTAYSILALKHGGVYVAGSVPASNKTSAALVVQWNGRSWSNVTPKAGPNEFALSLGRAGQGGIWVITVNANSAAEQIWHRADGAWSGPARVRWFLNDLSPVPHTASTWGAGTVKIRGQYLGVIALYGPTP